MQLQEAIQLIQCEPLRRSSPARWADLGAGSGLFSRALSALLPEGSAIYAIDKQLPPKLTGIESLQLDFVKDPLPFEQLDGILMANSLHYVKEKAAFLKKATKITTTFLIVEYDTDKPVPVWVPYPLSFRSLISLFPDNQVEKLSERPSAYGQANIYAALVNI